MTTQEMIQAVAVKVFESLGPVLPEVVDGMIAQSRGLNGNRQKKVCDMAASFILTSSKEDELVFLSLVAAEAITRLAEKES